ncbi:MAG TPA: M1 family aminopeptidase [Fimbriimonas sp.]|nr:M1 family aminopeptidase [Fimbriimonas sp.]
MQRSLAYLAFLAACVTAHGQTRPHPYDLQHVKWHVVLNEPTASVTGDVTNRVKPNRGAKEVWFDRGELKITSAKVDGVTARYRISGEKVYVALPANKRSGASVDIRIKYTGRPRAGLYFVPAKRAFPSKVSSIYTQGEMEDNRFWLVTYDYPDDKATSEGLIEVPKGYFALSNGKLLSKVDTATKSIFHWKMDKPHVTYLIALIAGRYERGHEQWGSLPVDWYVPQGLRDWGATSFSGTADMVRVYSERTGLKYPYAKFSQGVVPDYMFGGMENITMVTNTIGTLHPKSAEPLASSEGLVLHELAHQWFGDTVTTNGWGDAWINEGWASFLPAFYIRQKPHADPHWTSEDDFGIYRYDTFNGALGAHHAKPDRAVVFHGYRDPLDMFDGFIYAGGAARMFMLMSMLGEDRFWASCKQYLNERKFTSFDTKAFFKTWSKASGRDLTPFMNQWFYTPAAPKLTVKMEGTDVVISQPKPYFDLNLPVWQLDGNSWIHKSAHLTGAEVRVPFPNNGSRAVLVDPEVWTMSDFVYEQKPSIALALEMFKYAPNAGSRARIMDLFLRGLTPEQALGVANQIQQPQLLARYMGEIRPTDGAERWLRVQTSSTDRGVANAAVDRLGSFPSLEKDSLDVVRSLYRNDPNDIIRQTAFRSLLNVTKDAALAEEGWKKDSFNDDFRSIALAWWGDKHPDLARDRALQVLKTPPSEPVRVDAIRLLGRLKDKPGETVVLAALLDLTNEESFGARNTAISALGEYGSKTALPALRRFLNHPLVFFRGTARGAIERIGG